MLIKIMTRTHQRYSCCANISNSATTYLEHVGSESTKEAKTNSSSMKWTKSSRVQRLFATPIKRARILKNTPSLLSMVLHKIQGLNQLKLFNSAASFTKQDFESMNSTLSFLVTTFSGFPLYFPSYMDPKVPQPNFFSFSKSFHSNFGNSRVPFLPFFSDLLGF
jgi:hypothetical protein